MSHSFRVQPQTPQRSIHRQSSLEHILRFTLLSPPPGDHDIQEATLIYHLVLDDCERDGIVLRKPSTPNGAQERRRALDRVNALAEISELEEEFGNEPNNEDHHDEDDHGEDNPDDVDILDADGDVPLHKLFRCIHQYSPTDDGRVNFVRIILHGLFPVSIPSDDRANYIETTHDRSLHQIILRARGWGDYSHTQKAGVYQTLTTFATDFLEGFFAPLKAQGRCTPAVSALITPTSRTEVGPDQGVTGRLGNLRSLCLARDGNRCVVTRKLDRSYLDKLYSRSGGHRPRGPTGVRTEAAHIIPHSLNALTPDSATLPQAKRTVWRILNMFDPGISQALAGPLIDSPANAMMLVPELHDRFGRLECYFEECPALAVNTYTFHTTRGSVPLDAASAPAASHVVFMNRERDPTAPRAELPSLRLLKIHRACCLILSMSGAAEYVESVLRDTETLMESGVLAEDGSSDFGLLMRLRGLTEEWDQGQRVEVMAK